MLSIQGLICKDLKRQKKLPEKWEEMTMDSLQTGICYLNGGSIYEGTDVTTASVNNRIDLLIPTNGRYVDKSTSGFQSVVNALKKGFEFITEFDVVSTSGMPQSGNSICQISIGMSNYIQFGAVAQTGIGSEVRIKAQVGHYKVKCVCPKFGSKISRYYSFNGGDWISLGTITTDTNPTAIGITVGYEGNGTYRSSRWIRHSLKGTRLVASDGTVLFQRN